jgi:hypothetical protein
MADGPLVECHFYVPLVRDRGRQPHSPAAWRSLQDELRRLFGGLSGPERLHTSIEPVPGEYTSVSGTRVSDESFRYTVALEAERVSELESLLKRVANTFDQEAIYLSVRGEVRFVRPSLSDGFLDEGRSA